MQENWRHKLPYQDFDISKYINTTLASEVQRSQIGNFLKQKGAPAIPTTPSRTRPGEKGKAAEGVDMGIQVETGIIPVVYGHVGLSNTQFDLGQKPSELDAAITTQTIRMPISEGPIIGAAWRVAGASDPTRDPDNENYFGSWSKHVAGVTDPTIGIDKEDNLKQVLLNDAWIIDPNTSVANYRDVKFEMTYGDGSSDKQTATLNATNPLLDQDIESVDDSTNTRNLNDLGDVQAGKGENYVLYWNNATNQWEAKSFNSLLNETGATYDGGAGGSGGSGGDGGTGGRGGTGGVGPITGVPLKYTQFNPPPAHVKTSGEYETTTTVTTYTTPGSVDANLGAPLKRESETDPYFSTTITDVDDNTNAVRLTFAAPNGMYKEFVTTTTVKNGNIELCDTARPISGSGDLSCLTPDIEIAPDGQTSTTKTRVAATARVRIALVTQLCGRDFVLHEDTISVSSLRNGFYSQTETIYLSAMNAGSGAIVTGPNAGSQQIGPTDPDATASCDSSDAGAYDYANYTLHDYLTTYPNQIIQAVDSITVYAYILDEEENELSTPVYLQKAEVIDSMNGYESEYSTGETNSTGYSLNSPDHGIAGFAGDTSNAGGYGLANERTTGGVVTGSYGATKQPDPLTVLDGNSTGSAGDTGTTGTTGVTGTAGNAGTQGSVTVPSVPNVPRVEMANDSSYSGDGVADTVTLPAVTVTNADALANNTLTISVTSGTVDVVTVPGSVSATGRNTGTLTLIGTIADLQTCLNSGLKFYSTTATTGDVTIRFYISSSEGNSETTNQIRSEAITEHSGPTFTIGVNGVTGNFRCFVRNKAIMNTVAGSGTVDDIAADIAEQINDYPSIPKWTATASTNIVTVTGEDGIGSRYNGIFPDNQALTPLMAATITQIADGVSPSRITQPRQTTSNLRSNFVPALAFSNPLTASDVSWLQLSYRPPQGDGKTEISEVGVFVAGRKIQEPNAQPGLSFSQWQAAGYTSTEGWSANGAWVFFDYLTNTTYGLGNDIILTDNQKDQLYYDIYLASFWSQLQPTNQLNAFTGYFNGVFYGAESKFEALQKIADSFYGKFIYLNGNPRLFFDGQSYAWSTYTPTVKKLVNQTNAANLVYQSGSIDNLFNVINVKWNNPENYFRPETVQYKNTASIAKYGERETNIELTGCTSKQQALWHGAWIYETEASNSEIVTYIAGWDHNDVLPGDLIHINDTLRVDSSSIGGRVVTDNGDGTVTLDRNAGTGSIAIVDSLGKIKTGTVSGTTATISTSETKTVKGITYYADFADDAVFNVYSGDFEANYRVIAIQESEDGIYSVTAQKHDPDKYTRVWANTI